MTHFMRDGFNSENDDTARCGWRVSMTFAHKHVSEPAFHPLNTINDIQFIAVFIFWIINIKNQFWNNLLQILWIIIMILHEIKSYKYI